MIEINTNHKDLQFQLYVLNGELFAHGLENYDYEHENYYPDGDEVILRTVTKERIKFIPDIARLQYIKVILIE